MKLFKKKLKVESKDILNLIDGTFFYRGLIKKNLVYILFCAMLMIIQIGNRYKCEGQLKKIARLESELKDLRYESITSSAELMSISRQSKVSKLVKDRGLNLNDPVKAPQRIYIKD